MHSYSLSVWYNFIVIFQIFQTFIIDIDCTFPLWIKRFKLMMQNNIPIEGSNMIRNKLLSLWWNMCFSSFFFIVWLIDWIKFYAVSTIFQLCNGDHYFEKKTSPYIRNISPLFLCYIWWQFCFKTFKCIWFISTITLIFCVKPWKNFWNM